jgi:hypothetical protein
MSNEGVDCIDQRLRDSVEALREVGALIALSGDNILIRLHDIALTAAMSALTRSLRADYKPDDGGRQVH